MRFFGRTAKVAAADPATEDFVVYDNAEWHYGGEWPEGLAQEQAYVHTGMFVAWLIINDLVKPVDEAAPSSELELFDGVRERRITGAQAYAEWLDGNLASDQLTKEGNAFAASYFALGVGPYLTDYADVLARDLPTEYHVADTWENYDLLAGRIDERFAAWRATQTR